MSDEEPGDRDSERTRRDAPGARWNRKTAAAASLPAPGAPVLVNPRFEIGDELGRGGMGRVVAATDTALGRVVAIKQVLGDVASSVGRFEREVQITAQLEHPSIVPIYDAGTGVDGTPYYIMRRIDGEPLADRVARATTVPARLALVPNVLAAVDAIAFAHARRVVHRDLKPWNILVGDYGETLVIDWGLACRLEVDLEEDQVYGTPGFTAPEQARGEPGDPRADVYSLGATLLHVLSGGVPFAVSNTTDWLEAAKRGTPPPLDRLDRQIPRELVAIVGRAMAIVAADRYRDAGELAADLRAFLAGQLVAAHHYTVGERLARFVRRHKLALSIATVALVALAVVGTLAVVNVVHERDLAEAARLDAESKRKLADDRAEINLLDRASTLATTDPTRAVALLRSVTGNLARARDIAAKAAANGVAHGKRAHRGQVNVLAFAADGRLLSTGNDGSIQIHDVTSGESRVVVPIDEKRYVTNAQWTDGGATITFTAGAVGLYLVDVATAKIRTLDPEAIVADVWPSGTDDRIRFHDSARSLLVERATREGTGETVLARDVTHAIGDGELALVDGGGSLRIIDAAGTRVLLEHDASVQILVMALAWDGSRCAVAVGDAVVEFDLATGRERHRWAMRAPKLFYIANALYGVRGGAVGVLEQLGDRGANEVLHGAWSVLRTTRADRGVAVTSDGDVAIVEDGATYRIPQDRQDLRHIAGRAGSPMIAAGGNDGTITWWNLRDFIPQRVEIARGSKMCAVDERYVYTTDLESIQAVPRAGGPAIDIPIDFTDRCVARGGRLVMYGTDGSIRIADPDTREIHDVGALFVDRGGRYYTLAGRSVSELPAHGPSISRWTAPAEVRRFAGAGDWLAVELADRRLVRVDRAGAMSTIAADPVEQFAIDPRGTVWFASGRAVHRGSELAATLPIAVKDLVELAGGVMVRGVDDSIWYVTPTEARERASAAARERRVTIGERIVVTIDGGRTISTLYLDTGEVVARRATDGLASSVAIDVGDRTIAVHQSQSPWVELYADPVPADPAKLQAWIAGATNAWVDPRSDTLGWR